MTNREKYAEQILDIAYDGGMTSQSTGGDVSKWEYAKLAESEDTDD